MYSTCHVVQHSTILKSTEQSPFARGDLLYANVNNSGAQIRYTSRPCTRYGLASRRNVSDDTHDSNMSRKQTIQQHHKQKFAHTT